MRIDYSVPPFQFLVGSFDATDYLDAIELSLPHFELNTPLIWTGRFRLSYNRKARSLYQESQFSHLATPNLWRPGQVQVKLKIKGYSFPILRIERYNYNEQTKIGEGQLTQILALAATDRPAIEPDIVISDRPISNAIDALIVAAFEGGFTPIAQGGANNGTATYGGSPNITAATIPTPARAIAPIGEPIYGGLTTRNPIGDAQRLCGIAWQWLSVDTSEAIRTVSGIPIALSTPLIRSLSEVDWEPDLDNINFAAPRTIVTGSCQIPVIPDCPDTPTNPNLDRKGRPKVQKTQEIQPISKIFSSTGTDMTPIAAEEKSIYYQYPDDDSLDVPPGLIPAFLLFEIQQAAIPKFSSPYQTITIHRQPAGRIFESLGTNTTLQTAKIEIQNDLFKGSWIPIGKLNDSLGTDFTLALEKKETLTTTPVNPRDNHGGAIDPATGRPYCLEPAPVPEERKTVAEVPLKTISVKGEAAIAPVGWVPILPYPYVVDVGFLPQSLANPLAVQIAAREQRRRDAVQITMPIPDEWLMAGCPPLAACRVHNGNFQIDAPIVSISDGEAKFSFSGGRIDIIVAGNPQPLYSPISEAIGGIKIGTIVSSRILIPPALSSSIAGIKIGTIVSSQANYPAVSSTIVTGVKVGTIVNTQIAERTEVLTGVVVGTIVTSQATTVGSYPIEGRANGQPFVIEGRANGQPFTIEGS